MHGSDGCFIRVFQVGPKQVVYVIAQGIVSLSLWVLEYKFIFPK